MDEELIQLNENCTGINFDNTSPITKQIFTLFNDSENEKLFIKGIDRYIKVSQLSELPERKITNVIPRRIVMKKAKKVVKKTKK